MRPKIYRVPFDYDCSLPNDHFNFLFQDPRFNAEIDKTTGYKTHSILCMPIKSHDGEVPWTNNHWKNIS